jgi:hypothetical protein
VDEGVRDDPIIRAVFVYKGKCPDLSSLNAIEFTIKYSLSTADFD